MRIGTATATTAIAAALVLILAGCTPPPAPEPTPTPAFSSEDEAFAAAEATYRAYVDALNRVDLSDPETFEAVYELTTGEANAEARKTFSNMHADGWVVSGESTPTTVEVRLAGGANIDGVELAVCLDVSEVTLIDAEGTSMVAPDRPDVQSMLVSVARSDDTPTGMAIREFAGREGEPTCQ